MKANILYSKMALFEDDRESLAEYLGIKRQTLVGKLQGDYDFKQGEIDKIIARYKLTPEETYDIFFSKKEN